MHDDLVLLDCRPERLVSKSAYGDICLRHSQEAFPAYRATGEQLLHLGVIQQTEMGLKIPHLLSRRLPPHAVIGAIAHEPILFEQETKPNNEGREIVRLEEEAAGRCLAIYPLADAA